MEDGTGVTVPGGGSCRPVGRLSRKERPAGREKWKDVGYGSGRTAEIVFSAFRRTSGDRPCSKKWDNVAREVRI